MRTITREAINNFKLYLYEEEKSDNTIEKYMRDVRRFEMWINGRTVEKSVVLEYKKALCENYAPRSVNSMLSSLNAFFDFIGWSEAKVKTLKIHAQIFADRNKELTKAEYIRLLTAAKKTKNERLYFIMQTIGSTGIRISELKFITTDAIKSGQASINCKGRLRKVFLPSALCTMLKKYANKYGIKSGSVFVTKSGKPIDRSNIWREMNRLCEIADVEKGKVFPHNLRHLFARVYYSLQKDIVILADILGHSSINTTRIYTAEAV